MCTLLVIWLIRGNLSFIVTVKMSLFTACLLCHQVQG